MPDRHHAISCYPPAGFSIDLDFRTTGEIYPYLDVFSNDFSRPDCTRLARHPPNRQANPDIDSEARQHLPSTFNTASGYLYSLAYKYETTRH